MQRNALLALNLLTRFAIVYWLVEAWIMRDDPRFAGKAIPERNTAVVGSLSLLIPMIWMLQHRPWRDFPIGLDIAYLSIYALDMAGNSFDLYDRYRYFDLVPHFHSTGTFSLIVAVYWVRTHCPQAESRPAREWLPETTAVAISVATTIHVLLELQEYYTDVFAGTINVGGIADTSRDLAAGLVGAALYPPLWMWWLQRRPARTPPAIRKAGV